MATIRPIRESDRENLRTVCHKTATAPNYLRSKDLVCYLYCDSYIDHEAEHCFALVDDDDEAVGYILCAPNQAKFEEEYEPYRLKAKKISFIDAVAQTIENKMFKRLFQEYPAHLHIDILPEYQGNGNGTALMRTLEKHLVEIGVKAVRLSVGANNRRAHKFYEKNGYTRLAVVPGSAIVYGKKLSE